jgi:hypothetical protein
MSPQLELARFDTNPVMRSRCADFVSDEGCHVVAHSGLNRFCEVVEHMSLRTDPPSPETEPCPAS